MRFVAVALLVLALCTAALATTPPVRAPSSAQVAHRERALSVAKARWAHAQLRDYRYSVERICFCAPVARGPVVITVHRGLPRGTPREFRDVDTVPELHRTVLRLVHGDRLSVAYDRRGVPRRIDSDPSLMAADEEVSYRVTSFHALAP